MDKSHWTSTGEALFWKGKNKWQLQGNYDPDVGQTVLTDGSGQIHVYLSYVDAQRDPAKKGNLTVQCTSVSFAAVYKSPGYLCGERKLASYQLIGESVSESISRSVSQSFSYLDSKSASLLGQSVSQSAS